MTEINKIKSLSIWIFLLPILVINLCLYTVVNWWYLCHQLIPLFSADTCISTSGGAISFTFPYVDGQVSISRTARVFPTYWFFKPVMILTGFLLIKYWIYNFKLMRKINSSLKINSYFRFFGISSAIFLILHSIFLGIKLDYEIYKIFRKFVILSFILFELFAQSLLVINLFKIKSDIQNYFSKIVLNMKIILVGVLCLVTIISTPIMIGPGNSSIKHMLEWNFFTAVCSFYLLTFMFWKKQKTPVHTP